MASKRNKLLIFLGLVTIVVSKSHNQRYLFNHDFESRRISASLPSANPLQIEANEEIPLPSEDLVPSESMGGYREYLPNLGEDYSDTYQDSHGLSRRLIQSDPRTYIPLRQSSRRSSLEDIMYDSSDLLIKADPVFHRFEPKKVTRRAEKRPGQIFIRRSGDEAIAGEQSTKQEDERATIESQKDEAPPLKRPVLINLSQESQNKTAGPDGKTQNGSESKRGKKIKKKRKKVVRQRQQNKTEEDGDKQNQHPIQKQTSSTDDTAPKQNTKNNAKQPTSGAYADSEGQTNDNRMKIKFPPVSFRTESSKSNGQEQETTSQTTNASSQADKSESKSHTTEANLKSSPASTHTDQSKKSRYKYKKRVKVPSTGSKETDPKPNRQEHGTEFKVPTHTRQEEKSESNRFVKEKVETVTAKSPVRDFQSDKYETEYKDEYPNAAFKTWHSRPWETDAEFDEELSTADLLTGDFDSNRVRKKKLEPITAIPKKVNFKPELNTKMRTTSIHKKQHSKSGRFETKFESPTVASKTEKPEVMSTEPNLELPTASHYAGNTKPYRFVTDPILKQTSTSPPENLHRFTESKLQQPSAALHKGNLQPNKVTKTNLKNPDVRLGQVNLQSHRETETVLQRPVGALQQVNLQPYRLTETQLHQPLTPHHGTVHSQRFTEAKLQQPAPPQQFNSPKRPRNENTNFKIPAQNGNTEPGRHQPDTKFPLRDVAVRSQDYETKKRPMVKEEEESPEDKDTSTYGQNDEDHVVTFFRRSGDKVVTLHAGDQDYPEPEWVTMYKTEDHNKDDNYYVLSFNYMGNKNLQARRAERPSGRKAPQHQRQQDHGREHQTPEHPVSELDISHLEQTAGLFLEDKKKTAEHLNEKKKHRYPKEDLNSVHGDEKKYHYPKQYEQHEAWKENRDQDEKKITPTVVLKRKKAKKNKETIWKKQAPKKKFPEEEFKPTIFEYDDALGRPIGTGDKVDNGYFLRSFMKLASGENLAFNLDNSQITRGEGYEAHEPPTGKTPQEPPANENYYLRMYKTLGDVEDFDFRSGDDDGRFGYQSRRHEVWPDEVVPRASLDHPLFQENPDELYEDGVDDYPALSSENIMHYKSHYADDFPSALNRDASFFADEEPFFRRYRRSVGQSPRIVSHFRLGDSAVQNNHTLDYKPAARFQSQRLRKVLEKQGTVSPAFQTQSRDSGFQIGDIKDKKVKNEVKSYYHKPVYKARPKTELRISTDATNSGQRERHQLADTQEQKKSQESKNTKIYHAYQAAGKDLGDSHDVTFFHKSKNAKIDMKIIAKGGILHRPSVSTRAKGGESRSFSNLSNVTVIHSSTDIKNTYVLPNEGRKTRTVPDKPATAVSENTTPLPVIEGNFDTATEASEIQNYSQFFHKYVELDRGDRQIQEKLKNNGVENVQKEAIQKPQTKLVNHDHQLFSENVRTQNTDVRNLGKPESLGDDANKGEATEDTSTDPPRSSQFFTKNDEDSKNNQSLSSKPVSKIITDIQNKTMDDMAPKPPINSQFFNKNVELPKDDRNTSNKHISQIVTGNHDKHSEDPKTQSQISQLSDKKDENIRDDRLPLKAPKSHINRSNRQRTTKKPSTETPEFAKFLNTYVELQRSDREFVRKTGNRILQGQQTTTVPTARKPHETAPRPTTERPVRRFTQKAVQVKAGRPTLKPRRHGVSSTKPATEETTSTLKPATEQRSAITLFQPKLRPKLAKPGLQSARPTIQLNTTLASVPVIEDRMDDTTLGNTKGKHPTADSRRASRTNTTDANPKSDKSRKYPKASHYTQFFRRIFKTDEKDKEARATPAVKSRQVEDQESTAAPAVQSRRVGDQESRAAQAVQSRQVGDQESRAAPAVQSRQVRDQESRAAPALQSRRVGDGWHFASDESEEDSISKDLPQNVEGHVQKNFDWTKDSFFESGDSSEEHEGASKDEASKTVSPKIPFHWENNHKELQAKSERNYPMYHSIPKTGFSCRGRAPGYYADPDTGCQVFHMCHGSSAKHSFLCPNTTLFNQELLVCDWHSKVNCAKSESLYGINDNIYKNTPRKGAKQTPGAWNHVDHKTDDRKLPAPEIFNSFEEKPFRITQEDREPIPKFIVDRLKDEVPNAEIGRPRSVTKSYRTVVSRPNTNPNGYLTEEKKPSSEIGGKMLEDTEIKLIPNSFLQKQKAIKNSWTFEQPSPEVGDKLEDTQIKLVPDSFSQKHKAIKDSWTFGDVQKALNQQLRVNPELSSDKGFVHFSYSGHDRPQYHYTGPPNDHGRNYYVPDSRESSEERFPDGDIHVAGRNNGKLIIINRNRLRPGYDSPEEPESETAVNEEALSQLKLPKLHMKVASGYTNYNVPVKNLAQSYSSDAPVKTRNQNANAKSGFRFPMSENPKEDAMPKEFRVIPADVLRSADPQKSSVIKLDGPPAISDGSREYDPQARQIKLRIKEIKSGIDDIVGSQLGNILGGKDRSFKNVKIYKLNPYGSAEEINLPPFTFERNHQTYAPKQQHKTYLERPKIPDMKIQPLLRDSETTEQIPGKVPMIYGKDVILPKLKYVKKVREADHIHTYTSSPNLGQHVSSVPGPRAKSTIHFPSRETGSRPRTPFHRTPNQVHQAGRSSNIQASALKEPTKPGTTSSTGKTSKISPMQPVNYEHNTKVNQHGRKYVPIIRLNRPTKAGFVRGNQYRKTEPKHIPEYISEQSTEQAQQVSPSNARIEERSVVQLPNDINGEDKTPSVDKNGIGSLDPKVQKPETRTQHEKIETEFTDEPSTEKHDGRVEITYPTLASISFPHPTVKVFKPFSEIKEKRRFAVISKAKKAISSPQEKDPKAKYSYKVVKKYPKKSELTKEILRSSGCDESVDDPLQLGKNGPDPHFPDDVRPYYDPQVRSPKCYQRKGKPDFRVTKPSSARFKDSEWKPLITIPKLDVLSEVLDFEHPDIPIKMEPEDLPILITPRPELLRSSLGPSNLFKLQRGSKPAFATPFTTPVPVLDTFEDQYPARTEDPDEANQQKRAKYAELEREAELMANLDPAKFSPARKTPQGRVAPDSDEDLDSNSRPSKYADLEREAELKAERMIAAKKLGSRSKA